MMSVARRIVVRCGADDVCFECRLVNDGGVRYLDTQQQSGATHLVSDRFKCVRNHALFRHAREVLHPVRGSRRTTGTGKG